jgi:transposase
VQAAIAHGLARHEVGGLLAVRWEPHETTGPRAVGRGRGGPERPTRTDVQVRDGITGVPRHEMALAARRHRLGWRAQGTKAPADRLSLPAAVVYERGGWSLERDFHLVKDLPLGLSPWFVWKEEQIKGLPRLLTLARRLWTLLETQVRRALEQAQDTLAGLDEGQPTRTPERPTGTRLLKAFARVQITLTHVKVGTSTYWHLPPLSPLHEHRLRELRLPASLSAALADNSSSAVWIDAKVQS